MTVHVLLTVKVNVSKVNMSRGKEYNIAYAFYFLKVIMDIK